jgi:hypothetical protein
MKKSKSKPHRQRLTLLAERLQSCQPQDYSFIIGEYYQRDNKVPYMITDEGVGFMCFPFVYKLLSDIFPEDWHYIQHADLVIYPNNYEFTLEESMMEYFKLEPIEFVHCFVPILQNTKKYGGKQLSYCSKTKNIAFNIFCLLNVIFPNAVKRMVLIEKSHNQV